MNEGHFLLSHLFLPPLASHTAGKFTGPPGQDAMSTAFYDGKVSPVEADISTANIYIS